jgi:SHS2 domain-containing protein
MKPYEIIDHPADVGLAIYGRNLKELFSHAGLGFLDLVTDARGIQAAVKKFPETGVSCAIRLRGRNSEDLLRAWLKELLFIFSTQKLAFAAFDFSVLIETQLEAEARGVVFDPRCHEPKAEVKAVTYHQFELKKTPEGWRARVIFDL